MGDVYIRQVSYQVQYRQWWHVILGTREYPKVK